MVDLVLPANAMDMAELKFGRYLVLELCNIIRKGTKSTHFVWRCRCDCGNLREVDGSNLRSGKSTSCGCFHRERVTGNSFTRTHGLTGSPEYLSWCAMLARCYYENHEARSRYAGRGIFVCERWRDNFQNFLEDMGKRPSMEHSLERIDNNGIYEPGNCKWETKSAQARNRRTNLIVEAFGRKGPLVSFTKDANHYRLAWQRYKLGWNIERALSEPARKRA